MRLLKPVYDLTILDSQMDTQKRTEKRNSTGRYESTSQKLQKQPKGRRDLRRPRRRWNDQENFEL